MPIAKERLHFSTPQFLQGNDFNFVFRRVFLAVIVEGHYANSTSSGPLVLPKPGSASRSLQRAFQKVLAARYFPKWFRERISFAEDPISGPCCEELEITLRETSMDSRYAYYPRADLFEASQFVFRADTFDTDEVLQYFKISQTAARRWGEKLLKLWQDEERKEASRQAAIASG